MTFIHFSETVVEDTKKGAPRIPRRIGIETVVETIKKGVPRIPKRRIGIDKVVDTVKVLFRPPKRKPVVMRRGSIS
ncbi:unnamed protein product [Schistosoma guineensis]|nr:unnamed protein product [Schistosoma guineensis]